MLSCYSRLTAPSCYWGRERSRPILMVRGDPVPPTVRCRPGAGRVQADPLPNAVPSSSPCAPCFLDCADNLAVRDFCYCYYSTFPPIPLSAQLAVTASLISTRPDAPGMQDDEATSARARAWVSTSPGHMLSMTGCERSCSMTIWPECSLVSPLFHHITSHYYLLSLSMHFSCPYDPCLVGGLNSGKHRSGNGSHLPHLSAPHRF